MMKQKNILIIVLLLIFTLLLLSSCKVPSTGKAIETGGQGLSLEVQTDENGVLSQEHADSTCPESSGSDVPPTFSITNIPAGTKSLSLMMEDVDATDSDGNKNPLVHWELQWSLTGDLPTGLQSDDFKNVIQSYMGVCPYDDVTATLQNHEYVFTLRAFDDNSNVLDEVKVSTWYPANPNQNVVPTGNEEAVPTEVVPPVPTEAGEAVPEATQPVVTDTQLVKLCPDGAKEVSFTEWVSSDDGVLVLDRNKDGIIQAEDFFGNFYFVGKRNGKSVSNGFEDLVILDANGDGIFNKYDPQFTDLRVWKDTNSNGVADAGELLNLALAGVAELRVSYYETGEDIFKQKGTFKSTKAVELEGELQVLLDKIDAGQSTGEDLTNIETQKQEIINSSEVENNRLIGAGYFLLPDGNRAGSILTLDLSGNGAADILSVPQVTFFCSSTADKFISELVHQLDTESDVPTNKEKVKDLFRQFLRGLTEH